VTQQQIQHYFGLILVYLSTIKIFFSALLFHISQFTTAILLCKIIIAYWEILMLSEKYGYDSPQKYLQLYIFNNLEPLFKIN